MALMKKKLRKKLGKKALSLVLKFGQRMVAKHGEKMVAALLSGAAGGVAMAKAEDEMDEPKKGKKKKDKKARKAAKQQSDSADSDE